MKTINTYFAIFTILLTFTGVFFFFFEGMRNQTNYLNQRNLDTQNNTETITIQNNTNTDVVSRSVTAAELINYQAVARDASGDLMTNASVAIAFEIRNGAGGTAVFNETQNLNTDANGVFSAQIGSVNPLNGVNWLEIEPWLQVSLNGTNVGETQMASVPTALHSKQSGEVIIYGSGVNNADKMIASHSPAFPGWGIGYNDTNDEIDFLSGGVSTANVSLGSGSISTQGNVTINSTTSSPSSNRLYGNSMAIAYGSIFDGGGIGTGYGITSVTNSATGVYEVVLDLNTNPANTVVTITPFTGSFGNPEICGYEPTGANTFTIRIMNTAGAAVNSAFAFTVYGE